ncbi:MAG: hypothetical protein ACOC5E_01765, partial [Acidobacteriota bacterium]
MRERHGPRIHARGAWHVVLVAIALGALIVPAGAAGQGGRVRDALLGFDPVLLVEGREVLGNSELTRVHQGFRYHFVDEESLRRFEADTDRYAIRLGGLCVRLGGTTLGNPDLFRVYEGRIYLLAGEHCLELFDADPEAYLPPAAPSPLAETADAQARARGAELLVRALEGIGGSEPVDALRTYRSEGFYRRGAEGDARRVERDLA